MWVILLDYGRLEWHQTLTYLEKTPDIAYENVLKVFDNVWCVKALIVICSNLMITWKLRPRMGIIS